MTRFLVVALLCFSINAGGQIIVDSMRGLDPYFEGWLLESKKSANSVRVKGKIQREIISLFATAVNGPGEDAGESERLSRVVYPTGKYSLVSPSIDYKVVNHLPWADGPTSGWPRNEIDYRSIYDSISYSDAIPTKSINPIPLAPNKYRVAGLYLTERRMKEVSEFLEADLKGSNEEDGFVGGERVVLGPNAALLSRYIRLIEPHWGRRWNYRSYPVIKTIVIDKRATTALLNYRTHNGGGFARFKKIGKGWVLAESRITLMQ